MFKEEIFNNINNVHVDKFKKLVLPINYIPSGISIYEGFLFCMVAEQLGVEVIIESGTAGGMSTEIFAKYFSIPIFTIDSADLYSDIFDNTLKRLSKYSNVICLRGFAEKEIPGLLRKHKNMTIGVFFDGPKGLEAVCLGKYLLKSNRNILFLGIHDTCHKKRYHDMDGWNDSVFYSDDEDLLKYWFLNDSIRDDDHFKHQSCPGSGIGFVKNDL